MKKKGILVVCATFIVIMAAGTAFTESGGGYERSFTSNSIDFGVYSIYELFGLTEEADIQAANILTQKQKEP